jgi:hypothetical protein
MIRQIPVKLPKSFEEALGYPGDSRWVAFYWEPCGDEAMYDDGICSGDGNWWGFLQFAKHPNVINWLFDCNLGSSDGGASHWLLCDRESREVYVGEKGEVRDFLNSEAKKRLGELAKLEFSLEEIKEMRAKALTKLSEAMERLPTPSMAEIEEKMRRDQAAVKKMVAELGI